MAAHQLGPVKFDDDEIYRGQHRIAACRKVTAESNAIRCHSLRVQVNHQFTLFRLADDALAAQQWHAEVAKRLQAVLTKQEHYVYTMLFVEDMPVKDIAAALGVTPRTINTYKNTAIDKVAEMRKEFMQ